MASILGSLVSNPPLRISDLDGKELWSADVPGILSATPLSNNNALLVSTRKFVRELNRRGQTV